MTAPRQVLEGTTYLVTRRCSERRFFLKPSRSTNALFRYLLAVAADKYAVNVHAACVLSNHFHLVVTDTKARLPAFEQYLNALLARALNAFHGRWEHFWSPSSYSAVALQTPEDVVDKIAYTLANPVAGGLVSKAKTWPGVWTAPEEVEHPARVCERPERFFRADGKMVETAELALTLPPGFESKADFVERVRAALAEKETKARREHEGRFLGVPRIRAQKVGASPKEPAKRRGLSPRVASKDKWKRIEALDRLASFVEAYRAARAKLKAGVKKILFPAGTYWLRVTQGVACEPAPG